MTPRPSVGDMRQRVAIEAFDDAPDDIGGFVRSFKPLADAWAKIELLGSSEEFSGQRLEEARRYAITIRWRADLKSQMRFLYRGRAFLIRGVEDRDETRRFLTCICEEIT